MRVRTLARRSFVITVFLGLLGSGFRFLLLVLPAPYHLCRWTFDVQHFVIPIIYECLVVYGGLDDPDGMQAV